MSEIVKVENLLIMLNTLTNKIEALREGDDRKVLLDDADVMWERLRRMHCNLVDSGEIFEE